MEAFASLILTTAHWQDQFEQPIKGRDFTAGLVSNPEPLLAEPAVLMTGCEHELAAGGRAGLVPAHGHPPYPIAAQTTANPAPLLKFSLLS